jgi:P-type Ca2+ transporter type 2C
MPIRPGVPLFDATMLRRVIISAAVMGGGGFAVFSWLIANSYSVEMARSLLLLLFVFYENCQTLNSRSERRSVFQQSLFDNPLLLASVAGAQILQIAATFVPGLSETLGLHVFTPGEWMILLVVASSVVLVMEADKRLFSRASALGGNDRGRTGLGA